MLIICIKKQSIRGLRREVSVINGVESYWVQLKTNEHKRRVCTLDPVFDIWGCQDVYPGRGNLILGPLG